MAAGFLTAQIAGSLADLNLPAPGWWLVHGVIAALLGALIGLPRWWLPFQVLAPTAFALLLLTGIPTWVSGLALLVLLLLYGGGVTTRVPLYLSNRAACQELGKLLTGIPVPQAVDLGAGFGGPMRYLAGAYPQGRFVSVEASPATWLVAWLLAVPRLFAGPRRAVRVVWGDLWAWDLASADLIYVFLSPEPMPRIWERFQATAKPGALLVSNTFPVLGVTAQQVIDLPGRDDARLFVYRR